MIVQQATECFRSGQTEEALRLYELAASRFGREHFALNIECCRKLLGITSVEMELPQLSRESACVVVTASENLANWPAQYLDKPIGNWAIHFYFLSDDGLRPLHDRSLLDHPANKPQALVSPIPLPASKHYLSLTPSARILPADIESSLAQLESGKPISHPHIKALAPPSSFVQRNRVSIIIPTFRRLAGLQRALESVLTQDYPDKEIVVVDDSGLHTSSQQQTSILIGELQERYPDEKILLVSHKRNRNGAAARNTGLMLTTGEYVCFLDDDDIYLPGRISRSVDALRQTEPTCGAVYCGYQGWNSEVEDPARYIAGNLSREILLLEYQKHYLHTDTATYKRQAIMAIGGFDETYRRHQDLEFNLRFFAHYTMGVVKACLVQLSPHATPVSNKSHALDLAKLKQKFLSRFESTITAFDAATVSRIHLAHLAEIADKYAVGV